jgi:hypothetical protein
MKILVAGGLVLVVGTMPERAPTEPRDSPLEKPWDRSVDSVYREANGRRNQDKGTGKNQSA